ncbi:hypothetical protein F0224_25235 [Vibrio coralliilyticus]|uniref:imm11 family protein n=1 Tax=Vibrio coralliilyticus TaxID=190893 RepID=UPI000BAC21FE|nr:DUF1629 domain-containing protein [Vibrio coralliilyticus]NOI78954.1 hypothetical protein [Vibrio coralliilyticus]NRF14943.1 hypothetical protein [Vibrio coralliilyticus]PAW00528.1 hypothetical protein CKJ79_26540 [Vibrio coralliilyticus]
MNYYLLFSQFEKDEGSFSVREPWNLVLDYADPKIKLLKKKGSYQVDDCYDERGMSDCLKIGLGKLASTKIQQVFFDNGFTGIQFVPIEVHNNELYQNYAFMNVTAHYDLLDPIASEAEDFSDTIGGYTDVYEEIIDKDKLHASNIQHDCFTLTTYKDPYYVSENVKNALEAAGVTGIEFIPMEFA